MFLFAVPGMGAEHEWLETAEDDLRKRVHHAQVSLWKYRRKLREHFDGDMEVKLSDEEVQRIGRKIIKFRNQLKELLADGRLDYWRLETKEVPLNFP